MMGTMNEDRWEKLSDAEKQIALDWCDEYKKREMEQSERIRSKESWLAGFVVWSKFKDDRSGTFLNWSTVVGVLFWILNLVFLGYSRVFHEYFSNINDWCFLAYLVLPTVALFAAVFIRLGRVRKEFELLHPELIKYMDNPDPGPSPAFG